jgi:hypothetical protein
VFHHRILNAANEVLAGNPASVTRGTREHHASFNRAAVARKQVLQILADDGNGGDVGGAVRCALVDGAERENNGRQYREEGGENHRFEHADAALSENPINGFH